MNHPSRAYQGRSRSIRSRIACWPGIVALLLLAIAPPPVLAESAEESGRESKSEKPGEKAPPKRFDTWHATSLGRNELGIVVVNYWSKGPSLRAEVIVSGNLITTIVNGTHYHIFNSVIGTGLSIERNDKSVAEDAKRGRPFATELVTLSARGAEKIDETTMEGTNFVLELYQLTDEQGRKQLLVTESEPHLPVRLETFMRASGETTTLEYSGWNRGFLIADSFFKPPSQIEFEQMTYQEYIEKSRQGAVGPAPVFYGELLHGHRE